MTLQMGQGAPQTRKGCLVLGDEAWGMGGFVESMRMGPEPMLKQQTNKIQKARVTTGSWKPTYGNSLSCLGTLPLRPLSRCSVQAGKLLGSLPRLHSTLLSSTLALGTGLCLSGIPMMRV